jgi:hypothetical protein
MLGLGKAAEGGITASVVALAEGVMRAMFLTKLKVGAALVLVCGIVAAGAGLAVQCVLEEKGPRAVQPDGPKAVATRGLAEARITEPTRECEGVRINCTEYTCKTAGARWQGRLPVVQPRR